MSSENYPRDMVGYGRNPPNPEWPNGARLAISFVVNYEEGAESNILHGDSESEKLLTEIFPATAVAGKRYTNMESLYEYGSRAGIWRIMRLFKERGLNFTAFACAMALERNPEVGKAMLEDGHEIATHGYRWLDYLHVDEKVERDHIKKAVDIQKRVTGVRPLGFYQGKTSINSNKLAAEEGGFLYLNDNYSDDLPFWNTSVTPPILTVPYTLDVNDMKMVTNGFSNADDWVSYLKDAFNFLLKEGWKTPKMMTVGLHCRIVGHPARAAGLEKFLDYIRQFGPDEVWIAKRVDIANHWREKFPCPGGGSKL